MYKNHQQSKAAQQKLLKEKKVEKSVLQKAFTRCSQWDDKVSLILVSVLDVYRNTVSVFQSLLHRTNFSM